jgi:hypothetical protein
VSRACGECVRLQCGVWAACCRIFLLQELHSALRMSAHEDASASQRCAPPLESTYAHRVATSTLYITAAGGFRCAQDWFCADTQLPCSCVLS